MLKCSHRSKNVISSLISDIIGGGSYEFFCLFRRNKRKYLPRACNLISGTSPIDMACRSVRIAHRNVTDHGNDIVELERVVAMTISARLRDDGIRPVIYPTHSDPQSRARARATPGGFPPACILAHLPFLLLSPLPAPAQPWIPLTSCCLPIVFLPKTGLPSKTRQVKWSKLVSLGTNVI